MLLAPPAGAPHAGQATVTESPVDCVVHRCAEIAMRILTCGSNVGMGFVIVGGMVSMKIWCIQSALDNSPGQKARDM